MGLLSSVSFIKGAAKGALDIYDKAEATSNEGLENLKIARKEVTEELKTIGDRYDKAQQLGDAVGGGAFANYLFDRESIDVLADMQSNLAPTEREEQLVNLKSAFERLPESERIKYEEGNYSEKLRADLQGETEKIKQGLIANNNMGQSTANTLAGKIQRSVDKTFEPRRTGIVESIQTPTLREPSPVASGFEAIPSLKDGQQVNFQKAPLELFDEVLKVNEAYDKYVSDTYFTGTYETFSDENYYRDIGNIIGLPSTTMAERNNIDNFLEKVAEQIENEYDIAQTAQGVGFEILKADYVNRRYGKVFRYTGPLDLYDPRQE